jgi:hypothetical protein
MRMPGWKGQEEKDSNSQEFDPLAFRIHTVRRCVMARLPVNGVVPRRAALR